MYVYVNIVSVMVHKALVCLLSKWRGTSPLPPGVLQTNTEVDTQHNDLPVWAASDVTTCEALT